jgi:hypothetical protein
VVAAALVVRVLAATAVKVGAVMAEYHQLVKAVVEVAEY